MQAEPMRGGALVRRLEDLGALLSAHRALWAPRPFVDPCPAWTADFPEVADWLRGLDPDAATALDQAPHHPPEHAPAALRAWAAAARALCALPDLRRPPPDALTHRRLRPRVPARKWDQVLAFVGAAQPHWTEARPRVVDWCAGKGHLGRAIGLSAGLQVDLLERNAGLCETGAQLMRHYHVEGARFFAVDVLTDGVPHLGPDALAVGLHACGILWRTLLRASGEAGAKTVIAPCCYHALGGAGRYTPLSDAGRSSGLELSQPELRLSVAEERTASPSVRRARRREQAWRLGLDLLLREASGEDRYRPQGAFPKAMLDLDFEAFARAAADKLERPLPARFDAERAQRAGEVRAHEVFTLAQVRSIFRRPMELWLVLDAAVGEIERGRDVEVGTFCDVALTPRNVMLSGG